MSDYDDPVTDFTDSQYREPIQTPQSSGASGIEWLPSLPFAGRGKRTCNEADPTWEEVITMVVIPGHPEKIREASGSWEVLFRNVEQAKGMVDQVIGGVASWQGQTADSFKTHMTAVSQSMTDLVGKHRPVVQHLNSSADNLQTALDNCPIPEEMVDDVMRARQNFGEAGNLNVVNNGFIYDLMYPVFFNWAVSAVTSLLGIDDWVKRQVRNFISDGDDQAKAAYKSLAGQHVNTMDAMPKSSQLLTQELEQTTITPTIPPGGRGRGAPPGLDGGGGGGSVNPDDYNTSLAGAGGLSGLGSGAGGPGLGGPGGPGALAGAGAPSLSAGPPPSATSAGAAIRGGGMGGMPMGGMGGMAGAGGGGGARTPSTRGVGVPSGRTPGMGGMPMGGMAGAGGAGARGGARTPGAGGAGRVGGVGGGMAGMGAGGAGAGGRGAGGTRAGGAAGGVPPGVAGGAGGRGAGARGGMAGMGAGAGAGGDHAADHSTWLEEDEDVWGTDSDAAPPVLG